MRVAVGTKCCARHAAINGDIPVHALDGPCGPLTREDLGTMFHVAVSALKSPNRADFAEGALRAVAVLCASMAEEDSVA
jgi:hypothetical protein